MHQEKKLFVNKNKLPLRVPFNMIVNSYSECFYLSFLKCVYSPKMHYLDPNPATNLDMSAITADGVNIEWTAPSTGTFTTFQVTLNDGNYLVKTDTTAKEKTSSVFTGLEAGKEYTVTVVTVNGDGEDARKSTPITETFVTSEYIFIVYIV